MGHSQIPCSRLVLANMLLRGRLAHVRLRGGGGWPTCACGEGEAGVINCRCRRWTPGCPPPLPLQVAGLHHQLQVQEVEAARAAGQGRGLVAQQQAHMMAELGKTKMQLVCV